MYKMHKYWKEKKNTSAVAIYDMVIAVVIKLSIEMATGAGWYIWWLWGEIRVLESELTDINDLMWIRGPRFSRSV